MPALVEYADAPAEVRAVYDAIKTARGVPEVNDFWKALAVHPPTLARTWESLSAVMAPGALDPLVKEMLYLAVSMTNGCAYCIASHTAAARGKGMTDAQYGELLAIVGMASETNRLAEALRVPVDAQFMSAPSPAVAGGSTPGASDAVVGVAEPPHTKAGRGGGLPGVT